MCILFLYINPKPKEGEYKIIIVNNRDELYNRPTKHAHFWHDGQILGGMDEQDTCKGGTWLAVTRQGKISTLLNVFQRPTEFTIGRASRGFLVVDYLKSHKKGQEYLEEVKNSGKVYNPFNLLTLDPEGSSYQVNFYNSNEKTIHEIPPGIHGFGNCPLMKPFKKVLKGEVLLQNLINDYGKKECEEKLIDKLFEMMQNKTPYFPDPQLSEQGKGHPEEFIKSLSSIWVCFPAVSYGSRTTTVILVDQENQLLYRERTMQDPINPISPQWKSSNFAFTITPSNS